jgi:hypothetical protein
MNLPAPYRRRPALRASQAGREQQRINRSSRGQAFRDFSSPAFKDDNYVDWRRREQLVRPRPLLSGWGLLIAHAAERT